MNQLDIVIKDANKEDNQFLVKTVTGQWFKHLNNQSKDQKLDKIHHFYGKNLKFYHTHKNIFTDKEFKYLNETDYNTSNFYGLPKIQKSRIKTNALKEQNSEFASINELQDLKVRTTVGGPKCLTRRLSELIDTLLKTLLYFKIFSLESTDFILKSNT